ncbi:MAG: hypothetical protein D3913_13915 [Candidatus Electrothrix sp. LOE1_4_5]|nr:hypothetical protein [Candidatus Electrothrix gigas]
MGHCLYLIWDDPESAAKRLWTREWWEEHRSRFELLTAPPVLDELEQGDYPTKEGYPAIRQKPATTACLILERA